MQAMPAYIKICIPASAIEEDYYSHRSNWQKHPSKYHLHMLSQQKKLQSGQTFLKTDTDLEP
jgi:hypothetical protein